ncbi:MAG: ribonuclease HIII [Candidatus Firestonebacteria bacterium RIFOXYA2_FULL_40_8]|nr:MAG: ribonuclease HIII [Candidatus Firestonebacteria bacterium RIFOXYA2_FULL_40_8]
MTAVVPAIGVDESGKGDYFGPLVIAGVYDGEGLAEKLKDLNIRDSKLISDNRILTLASEIKKHAKYSVVVIGPKKYNELYAKFKNLNKLLAWGHARVIENILESTPAKKVISDKFGDDKFIRAALMEKGKQVEVVFETKAERHFCVAAASILARAEFLSQLQELSKTIGFDLPKGASKEAEAGVVKLRDLQGYAVFKEVAKLHFKTTAKFLVQKDLF